MLNPHGWRDYRYRMLYTDRVHFIHANVTSTTTACPRRWMRWEESPRHSTQPWLRTPDTRLRLCIPEAQRQKGKGHVEGGGWGNASCTHAKPNQTKKNQPQINDENGLCSIFRKLPISPCLQSGLLLLSNRARGDVREWRRQADGGRRSGPSLSSPSLAHWSVSHQLLWPSPYRRAPVAFASILPGAGGRERAMGKGLVAISRSCW